MQQGLPLVLVIREYAPASATNARLRRGGEFRAQERRPIVGAEGRATPSVYA